MGPVAADAVIEYFWSIVKRKMIERPQRRSREHLATAFAEWIERRNHPRHLDVGIEHLGLARIRDPSRDGSCHATISEPNPSRGARQAPPRSIDMSLVP